MSSSIAAVPTGSMVSPCCCKVCTDYFGVDLHFSLAGIAPCAGATLTGVNTSGLLVYAGGAWSAPVGTATFTGGLSGSGILTVGCIGDGFSGGVSYDDTLIGYNSFATGPSGIGTTLPVVGYNTNTCGSFELGSGGTLTITT